MKKVLVIILIALTILSIIANSYFEEKAPQYEKKLADLSLVYTNGSKIAETNKWIASSVIPTIDKLENFKTSQNYVMNLEESLKVSLNTTLEKLDEDKKGFIVISIKSQILRNDVDNLLKLFKLEVSNGYIRINSFSVDSEYITTNFDLIKFYKD